VNAKLIGTLASAGAAKRLVIGNTNKRFKKAGRFKFRVPLSSTGRHVIADQALTKITLTVTGKAHGKSTTKKKTFRVA
jgi:hypothetical protein